MIGFKDNSNLRKLFKSNKIPTDVKIAKELSDRFYDKEFPRCIKAIDNCIMRGCKKGEYNCSYYAKHLDTKMRDKIINHYKDKGFKAYISCFNFIDINWE